jgi:hypothetical protein
MQLYLIYSGSQEDEDTVWGVYDDYAKAVDNARVLMDRIFKIKFFPVVTNYLIRWESKTGHYHIYIDEETLNAPVS